MPNGLPYWRLSSVYFFHFVLLGAIVTFFPVYLKELGYSASEVGTLIAAFVGARIVIPFFVGSSADKLGSYLFFTRLAAVFTALGVAFLWVADSFYSLAIVLFAIGAFHVALTPLIETMTIKSLGVQRTRYALIRVWGSVGFIIASVLIGGYLEHYGFGDYFDILTVSAISLLIVCYILPKRLDGHPNAASANSRKLQLNTQVMLFFVLSFLMILSHGPYYTFFSVLLDEQGYSKTAIGLMWSLGVAAEIIMFMVTPKLLVKYSVKGMLILCFVMTAIRWLITAYFSHILPVMIVTQCLHALSFGLFHALAVQSITDLFGPYHQAKGQAIYSGIGFGLAGVVGSGVSGLLWEHYGYQVTFLFGTFVTIISLFLLIIFWKNQESGQDAVLQAG